jgi:hypothetical protein
MSVEHCLPWSFVTNWHILCLTECYERTWQRFVMGNIYIYIWLTFAKCMNPIVVHTITNKSYSVVSVSLWVNITLVSRAQLLPLSSLLLQDNSLHLVGQQNKFTIGVSTERSLQSTVTMLQHNHWILSVNNVMKTILQKLYCLLIYKSMENIYKKS